MRNHPGPIAASSGFRGRAVLLLPMGNLADWRLFTARCDGAIRTLDEKSRPLLELVEAVQAAAGLFSLTAQMRHGQPDGPIEFEVRGQVHVGVDPAHG